MISNETLENEEVIKLLTLEDFNDLNDPIQFTALVLAANLNNSDVFKLKVESSQNNLEKILTKYSEINVQMITVIVNSDARFNFNCYNLFVLASQQYRKILYDGLTCLTQFQQLTLLVDLICLQYDKEVFNKCILDLEQKETPNIVIMDLVPDNLIYENINNIWVDKYLINIIIVTKFLQNFSQDCIEDIIIYFQKTNNNNGFYVLYLCLSNQLDVNFLIINYCQKLINSVTNTDFYCIYNLVQKSIADLSFLTQYVVSLLEIDDQQVKYLSVDLILKKYKQFDQDFLQDFIRNQIFTNDIEISNRIVQFILTQKNNVFYSSLMRKCLNGQNNETLKSALLYFSDNFVQEFEQLSLIALKHDKQLFIEFLDLLNQNFNSLYLVLDEFQYNIIMDIFSQLQQKLIFMNKQETILQDDIQYTDIFNQENIQFILQFQNKVSSVFLLRSIEYQLDLDAIKLIVDTIFKVDVYYDYFAIQLLQIQDSETQMKINFDQLESLLLNGIQKILKDNNYFSNDWLTAQLKSINQIDVQFTIIQGVIKLAYIVDCNVYKQQRRSSGLTLSDLEPESAITFIQQLWKFIYKKEKSQNKYNKFYSLITGISEKEHNFFKSLLSYNASITSQVELIEEQLEILSNNKDIIELNYAYNILNNLGTFTDNIKDKDLIIKAVQGKISSYLTQMQTFENGTNQLPIYRFVNQEAFIFSNLSLTKQLENSLLYPFTIQVFSSLRFTLENNELKIKSQPEFNNISSSIANIILQQVKTCDQLPKILSIIIPYISLIKNKHIQYDMDILFTNFMFYEIKDFTYLLELFCSTYVKQYNIQSKQESTAHKAQQLLPCYSIYYLIHSLSHCLYSVLSQNNTIQLKQLNHLLQNPQLIQLVQQILTLYINLTVLGTDSNLMCNFAQGIIQKFQQKRMKLLNGFPEDVRAVQMFLLDQLKQNLANIQYDEESLLVSYPQGIFE